MRGSDLVGTIEAIHAAGLEETRWPQALEAIMRAIGGRLATVETIDKVTFQHRMFLAHGLPPPGEIEYLDHYAALNPRFPSHYAAKLDDVIYDYGILDEAAMRRSPFYADFLPRFDCRFFISGIVEVDNHDMTAVTVQRSARQGHVDRGGIALMRRLVPHVRQALDVSRRLKLAADTQVSLERTLDWLADGVALVRADGAVLYANVAFQAMTRRHDGIRLRKGEIEFADSEAQEKFGAALGAAARLRAGKSDIGPAADFVAARAADGLSYLISVRPLLDERGSRQQSRAVAIVFARDPFARGAASIDVLRELFGLTEAEAALAESLQSGMTLAEYASRHALSVNTVYTHLRRLREKTGCRRMVELMHKLNELRPRLRVG